MVQALKVKHVINLIPKLLSQFQSITFSLKPRKSLSIPPHGRSENVNNQSTSSCICYYLLLLFITYYYVLLHPQLRLIQVPVNRIKAENYAAVVCSVQCAVHTGHCTLHSTPYIQITSTILVSNCSFTGT